MVLDRGSLKRESKALLKPAQVSPYLFTLVLLAIMFVINGISDYVQMDDEFAYVYSLRFDMDLSFLALHRAFPAFAVWFVSIVCTLLGVVLNVGASLYHLGIRRGEEMPFVTLFDGFAFVGKIILLYVVQVIFISLWTLLLVIPGIVAAYRYRFAMLNLCENPEIGVMEALNMSPGLQVAAVRAGSELYRMEYSGGSDAGHSGYLGGAVHRPEQHRLLPGDQKDQGRRLLPAAAGG
mgnify:CR=1 FL=1